MRDKRSGVDGGKSQGGLFCIFVCLAISAVAVLSCELDLLEEGWEGDIPSGGIQAVSDLFERPAEDTDMYRLHTNDRRFSRLHGSSVWLPLDDNSQDPFDSWEVEVTKSSGDRNAGYGIVLCQQRDSEGIESMLTVMIRVDRYYQIGKVVGKKYTKLLGWRFSKRLKGGYGISNRIEVEREDGEFVLTFNGGEVVRFRDKKEPIHEGGVQGFLAVISPLESFPSVPVDIGFKVR